MDTEKIPFPGKKIIAHRGASALEKENTLAAFIAAGNRSYYGIECDIHRTADGKYVVIHDESTKRVATDELIVEQSSFGLVRSVLINDIDGQKRKDLFVPSLDEYLKICKKYDNTAVIEIKGPFEKPWIEEVTKQLEKSGCPEKTVFISFHMSNLIALREIAPAFPAQFLTAEWSDRLISELADRKLDLDILYTQLTKSRIDALHAAGIKVNCWTVDDGESALRLLDCGVDYITSNRLE